MLDDSYQIVGRLGADPELSRNGKNTIMFSVCINKTVSGEKVEKWVNCFISDKSTRLKNVAQYLKKGKNVLIEGSPFASHYLKDNKIFDTLNINVFDIKLIDGSPENDALEYISDAADEGEEALNSVSEV